MALYWKEKAMPRKTKTAEGRNPGGADALSNDKKNALVNELLSHPIRVRLLGWLAGRKPCTQHEIGRALSLSNAAVHYHIKLLESVGLVKFEGTRPGPKSITEKLYSADPRQMNHLKGYTGNLFLDYTADSIREMHREGIKLVNIDFPNSRFYTGCFIKTAPHKELMAFKKKLDALVTEFLDKKMPQSKDSRTYSVTFSLLPSNAGGWAGSTKIYDQMPEKDSRPYP